jgi:hypothetical protein
MYHGIGFLAREALIKSTPPPQSAILDPQFSKKDDIIF